MQQTSAPITSTGNHLGTGGFLDPDRIINEFGLKPGMSVADFGSGAGYFTILAASKVGKEGRVYAFDIMESALDSVREKAKSAELDNVEIVRTNLEVAGGSGLSDQSQDVVLLANILFQSDKKSDIVKEAKRVLKDNGTIIIIDWKKGAGGFGPPDSLRMDDVAIRSVVAGEGMLFERDFNAGQFHFGLIFKKNFNFS